MMNLSTGGNFSGGVGCVCVGGGGGGRGMTAYPPDRSLKPSPECLFASAVPTL